MKGDGSSEARKAITASLGAIAATRSPKRLTCVSLSLSAPFAERLPPSGEHGCWCRPGTSSRVATPFS
jgi:hypothetical protein